MKRKYDLILLAAVLLVFMMQTGAYAEGIVLKSDYRPAASTVLPDVLNVGIDLDCGPLAIRLSVPPILTKSGLGIVADSDAKYLVLRVCLTNKSDETISWLTTDSFSIQETYMDQYYGRYKLDAIMSAKIAAGYKLPAFYSPIEPGRMLQTILVFDVFPDIQSWVVTFSPKVFGEAEAEETVLFQLPKALVQ